MAKFILNIFGALLFAAALTTTTGPARAQDIADIQQNETCQQKVGWRSWYLCGAVPANGHITYENVGIHGVTVFTTGPDGVQCDPPTEEFPDAEILEECGALQVHENLPVNGSSQTDVETGQLVYISRADNQFSSRTIAIDFTAVPPNLGDASPFSDARMFVEFNATTEDVGIRAFIDGESWNSVRIIGPDQRIFQVSGGGSLGELGLTELSFATHEPALEDLPLEDLMTLFPEGEYEFRGRSVEGGQLVSTATLTHDLPDAPSILTPEEGALVDPADAVISWDPVTEPAGIEIAGYRVTVERGDRGRTLSLELPAETTSVPVPADFLEPGTDYLLQVLAIEVGGNQTITEAVFDTSDGGLGAEDIKAGDICEKTVVALSWHLCGAAPAAGQITVDNTGPHGVTVFTTAAEGIRCSATNDDPIRDWKESERTRCGLLQVSPEMDPFDQFTFQVSAGDLVYIARIDKFLSDRTLAIQFWL
jgi:Fibronectin type III domain